MTKQRPRLPLGISKFLKNASLQYCYRCDSVKNEEDFYEGQVYCKKCLRLMHKQMLDAKTTKEDEPLSRRLVCDMLHIKPCKSCGQILPVFDFYTDKGNDEYYHKRCKSCYRMKGRPTDKLSKEWIREWFIAQGNKLLEHGYIK